MKELLATTLSRLQRLQNRFRVRPSARVGLRLATKIVTALAGEDPQKLNWRAGRVLDNLSEFRCVVVLDGDDSPVAMIKLARGPQQERNLARNKNALKALGADPRLADIREWIPSVIGSGEVAGVPYIVERWIPGTLGETPAPESIEPMLELAAHAIHKVAACTGRAREDEALLSISHPARQIASLEGVDEGERRALRDLERRLLAGVGDQPSSIGHTDYWLGNVFFSDDLSAVTGIIDWAGYRSSAVADVDLITLTLAARLLRSDDEMGDVVLKLVRGGWSSWEKRLLEEYSVGSSDWVTSPNGVLLAWLWLAAGNTEKARRFLPGTRWFAKNVSAVLRSI